MNVIIDGVQYAPLPVRPTGTGLVEALSVQLSGEFEDLTVRDYLRVLLTTLWSEQEEFSGKRPFGNSGWEYDLYAPLIKAGHIEGSLDEDGYVVTITNDRMAHAFVNDLILAVFNGVQTEESSV